VVSPNPAAAQLNLVSHTASATVSVIVPPAPAAPTGATASQVGDQLNVGWTPAPATAHYLINSVITATPTGGSTAPVLTVTVSGTGTSGSVPGVVASTTYSVTVRNGEAGGQGPASAPVMFTTGPATIAPSAPTITHEWWASGYLALSWTPGAAGSSVIDQYEVSAAPDGNASQAAIAYVAGSTTSAYLTVDTTVDYYSLTVRAHNAAGWGPWSAVAILYGL
jgi:hypothetical protein